MDALSTGHTTGDQMLTRIDMLDACAHIVGNDRTALGRRRARQPMRAAVRPLPATTPLQVWEARLVFEADQVGVGSVVGLDDPPGGFDRLTEIVQARTDAAVISSSAGAIMQTYDTFASTIPPDERDHASGGGASMLLPEVEPVELGCVRGDATGVMTIPALPSVTAGVLAGCRAAPIAPPGIDALSHGDGSDDQTSDGVSP